MNTIKRLPLWTTYALLVYMPFHIFLSQWLSELTGGLDEWKVAKDVVLMLATGITVLLVWQQRKATKAFNHLIVLSLAYLSIHLLVWAVNPSIYKQTGILGTVYNNRLLWYAILAAGASLLWPKEFKQQTLLKLIVILGTTVSILGILQYFLPKDIMTHFGYSLARGVKPAFFIDDKTNLPRIMSTLRDPNSLGAYLIVPICILIGWLGDTKRRMSAMGLLLIHAIAVLLTFSRGSVLGIAIAIGYLLVVHNQAFLKRYRRTFLAVFLGAVLIFGGGFFVFRHNYFIDNLILHDSKATVGKDNSNNLHVSFAKNGLKTIVKKPWGHGPGTAGNVSLHNPQGSQITENYYIQLGIEVGIVGLLLFLYILLYVFNILRREDSPLGHCLVASLLAYVVMGMVTHIWTNEAVAAQWWILAGICLASAPKRQQASHKA